MMTRGATGLRYSTGAILLHWAIALLLIAQMAMGWRLEQMEGTALFSVMQLHKSVGITILLLTLARLAWRAAHRPPAMLIHGWERVLAVVVHWGFYALLLALPLSGWLLVSTSRIPQPTMVFGLFEWPHIPGVMRNHGLHEIGEGMHGLLGWVMAALFALHVAGALKHHFLDRDAGLARMVPGASRRFDWRLGVVALAVAGAAAWGWTYVPGARAPVAAAAGPQVAGEPDGAAAAPDNAAVPLVPDAAEPASGGANAAQAAEESQAAADEEAEAQEKAAAPVQADRWRVLPGSALGFATSWSGTAIEGRFRTWTADIRFSPQALESSRVRVRIETASAATGESSVDEALPGTDWFSSAAFPAATFSADRFRALGGDRYEARGTLSLRGVSHPVVLPFRLTIDGGRAQMTGSATIDRIRFGVGQGDWAATDAIPAPVSVHIDLKAARID